MAVKTCKLTLLPLVTSRISLQWVHVLSGRKSAKKTKKGEKYQTNTKKAQKKVQCRKKTSFTRGRLPYNDIMGHQDGSKNSKMGCCHLNFAVPMFLFVVLVFFSVFYFNKRCFSRYAVVLELKTGIHRLTRNRLYYCVRCVHLCRVTCHII